MAWRHEIAGVPVVMREREMRGEAWVYLAYSFLPDGLLYVGSTCDLRRRLMEHRRTGEWFGLATTIFAFPQPNPVAARAVEARLIWHEGPGWNRAGRRPL
jgi:hypothetical protein